jgi:uncharacterized protein YkwD
MPGRARSVLVTVAVRLAATALLLPLGLAGPAHAGRALAQDSVCHDPDADREPTLVEEELLTALNTHRQARGLALLTPSPSLMRTARLGATRLASTTGTPTDADLEAASRGWMQRLADCGYTSATSVGETLGFVPGRADAAAVLRLWLDGDANQRLLETPAYQAVGVAAVETDAFTFWVLELAADPS